MITLAAIPITFNHPVTSKAVINIEIALEIIIDISSKIINSRIISTTV